MDGANDESEDENEADGTMNDENLPGDISDISDESYSEMNEMYDGINEDENEDDGMDEPEESDSDSDLSDVSYSEENEMFYGNNERNSDEQELHGDERYFYCFFYV